MDKVYICSRYRADDPEGLEKHLETAKWACRKAVSLGYKPVCPHLLYPQFLDDDDPAERRMGLDMALDDLRSCREVWIVDDGTGRSEGMKGEIKLASKLGKYIRHIRTADYAENYAKTRMEACG